MNDWVFDLQRFAEGEAAQDAPADTPAYEAQQGAQESPATGAGTPPAVEAATEGVAIRIDPTTGARTVVNIGAEQQTAPSTEEHAEESAEQPATPPPPAPYTAEELLASMTTGRTDETRIPEELRAPYIAIRQQQQIAALTAQQQMQQSAPPVQQTQETVQDAEIYRRIQEAAEQKAQQELGITPEELSGMSYSDDPNETKKAEEYRIAVQMNVNAIAREIDAYQSNLAQQQAEAQAFAAEFLPKMQQAQAKEPNFNQIDVMMESYYQELPYHEAVRVEDAVRRFRNGTCTRADVPVLEGYYEKTRAAFYAKKTGLTPTPQPAPKAAPPSVEGAGRVAPSAPQQTDWSAMRSMDVRARNAFLREHLFSR